MKRRGAIAAPPCKKRPPGHDQDTGWCAALWTLMIRQGRHEFTGTEYAGWLHSPSLDDLISPLYMVT